MVLAALAYFHLVKKRIEDPQSQDVLREKALFFGCFILAIFVSIKGNLVTCFYLESVVEKKEEEETFGFKYSMMIEFWSFALIPFFLMQFRNLHDSRAIFVYTVMKPFLKKVKYLMILIMVQIIQKLFFNIITILDDDFQNGTFARSLDQLAAIVQTLIIVYLITYQK